jgi:cell division protein FtsL
MAQIDPNISLGFRMPQVQDPVAAAARVQEVGVNALKMQELQRGLQEEQQIRNYLAGADLAKPETRAGLAKFGKAGLATGKLLAEQERAGLETKKLSNEISKQDLERSRERTSDLAFNPSNENITAHLQDSIKRGEMTVI